MNQRIHRGANPLEEKIFYVNYIIDGIVSVIPTRAMYEQVGKGDDPRIKIELTYEGHNFLSSESESTEHAILNLKQILPSNINIAGCVSCKHGNYCPYGDLDNEIFCFKDISFSNKMDVCDFFSNNSHIENRSRQLFDFCTDYKPITDEYFTYNDWGL